MSQNDFNKWSTVKAEELFTLSHKLMDVAKQLTEYHAAELRVTMDHAVNFAKVAAEKDLTKLRDLQEKTTKDAHERLEAYQTKVKTLVKQMKKETADEVEKHVDKAVDSLTNWLDQTSKKIPLGGDELSKVVKDVTLASAKVFKEGSRAIDHAMEEADKQINHLAKNLKDKKGMASPLATKTASAQKAAPTKKVVATKRVAAVKKMVAKKTTAAKK